MERTLPLLFCCVVKDLFHVMAYYQKQRTACGYLLTAHIIRNKLVSVGMIKRIILRKLVNYGENKVELVLSLLALSVAFINLTKKEDGNLHNFYPKKSHAE